MSRSLWLSALVLAASTGCGDSLVGPVQGSYTSTLTFVEPTSPTEVDTCCPSPRACEPVSCAGTCSNTSCCPASHCDQNGRRK